MKCPVCPFEEISEDQTACPNCGTDLTAIMRVRELGTHYYNQALQCARDSQYDQAMNLASSAICLKENFTPAVTLLGKLLWRSGRYRDAVRQWQTAAAENPGDAAIGRLLEHGRRQMAKADKKKPVGYWLAFALMGIGLLAVLWIAIDQRLRRSALAAEMESVNQAADALRDEFERYKTNHPYDATQMASIKIELTDLYRQLSAASDSYRRSTMEVASLSRELGEAKQAMAAYVSNHHFSDRAVADMKIRLNKYENAIEAKEGALAGTTGLLEQLNRIDGVITSREGEKATLKFEQGIFADSLDSISHDGKKLLDQIAIVLRKQMKPFRILVEGHTDDVPIIKTTDHWQDNWSLGLYRAHLVLTFLQNNLKSSRIQLSCCSAGASNPPFVDPIGTGSRRNRTVVLHFWPNFLGDR